jgi:membrane protein
LQKKKQPVTWLHGIIQKYANLRDAQIFSSAAELSYYLIMTFFPVLIVLNALLSLLVPDISEISDLIEDFLPQNMVMLIEDYVAYQEQNTSAKYLYLGIFLTLTSMTSTTHAVRTKISTLYGNSRYRKNYTGVLGWITSKIFSLLISILVCVLIYGCAILLLLGEEFLNRLYAYIFPGVIQGHFLFVIRYLPLGIILYIFFLLIYKYSPGIKITFHSVKKGAAISTLLLLVISFFYSIYVDTYASYAFVYGSLASFIITLLWIYLANMLFLVGAYVNARYYQREMTVKYGHFKME